MVLIGLGWSQSWFVFVLVRLGWYWLVLVLVGLGLVCAWLVYVGLGGSWSWLVLEVITLSVWDQVVITLFR